MRPLKRSPRAARTVLIAAALIAAELATQAAVKASRLHLNYTDSVPVGIYREVRGAAGSFAGFCLSSAVIQRALAAGLQPVRGDCPYQSAPVLKPLFRASAAQPVSFTGRGFFVSGKLIPNTAPKPHSRTGAALLHYPFGTYTSGLWAISSFNPNSFDSRYFGPVAPSAIRFYAKPVWTR